MHTTTAQLERAGGVHRTAAQNARPQGGVAPRAQEEEGRQQVRYSLRPAARWGIGCVCVGWGGLAALPAFCLSPLCAGGWALAIAVRCPRTHDCGQLSSAQLVCGRLPPPGAAAGGCLGSGGRPSTSRTRGAWDRYTCHNTSHPIRTVPRGQQACVRAHTCVCTRTDGYGAQRRRQGHRQRQPDLHHVPRVHGARV
jgi:hypothetical protein